MSIGKDLISVFFFALAAVPPSCASSRNSAIFNDILDILDTNVFQMKKPSRM
jgi:hypothetical protein